MKKDILDRCIFGFDKDFNAVQVSSAIFTKDDWKKNSNSEARANLLVFPKIADLNEGDGAKDYIAYGESTGIQGGYKCGIRDEWQIIPSLRISDALFVRRNYLYPKFLINQAGAYTTDTMHRVQINDGININALVASYYNSLTLAFSEICGRSHGGGVLELMPNEVESIIIPYDISHGDILNYIDKSIRQKRDLKDLLDHTNRIILKDTFGFSDSDIDIADSIWRKLSERRLSRGK